MASRYSARNDENDDVLDNDEVAENNLSDADDREASGSSKADEPVDFNIAARQRLRDELSSQVEAFLARGGKIREIPSSLNSSRPSKAVSDIDQSM